MDSNNNQESVEALLRLACAQDDAILALAEDADKLSVAIWIISRAIGDNHRVALKEIIVDSWSNRSDMSKAMDLSLKFLDNSDTMISEYKKLLNEFTKDKGVVHPTEKSDA